MRIRIKKNILSATFISAFIVIALLSSYLYSQTKDSDSILSSSYKKSLLLIGSKQYDEAIKILKQSINENPSLARAYLKLAQVYNKKSELDSALIFFNNLLHSDPENAYALFTVAWIYWIKDNYQKAQAYSDKAFQFDTRYAVGIRYYVIIMNKLNKIEKARKFLEQMIDSDPQNAAAYYGLGYLYQLQEHWDLALPNIDKALEIKKDLLDAYISKGTIYFYQSNYNELIRISQYALHLAEENRDLEFQCNFLGNIGLAHSYLGNHAEAITFNKKSLHIAGRIGYNKEYGRMLGNIGCIYMNISELDSAATYLHKAVEKMKETKNKRLEGSYLRYLGSVYYMKADYADALQYFKKALFLLKETGDKREESLNLWNLGLVYWSYGNYTESLQYCNQALRLAISLKFEWGEGRILNTMGVNYMNLGNYSIALDCYKNALAISRKIGDKIGMNLQLGHMAIIYGLLGDFEKALDYYNQALEISREIGNKSGEARNLTNIGTIYDSEGEYDKALDLYNQALSINKEIQDKKSEATLLGNIGRLYIGSKDNDKAEQYIKEALKITRSLDQKSLIASENINLGDLYMNKKRYATAFQYFSEALKVAQNINEPGSILQANLGLSVSCYQQKDYKKSLFYAEQAVKQVENIRSSITSEEFKTGFFAYNIQAYDQAITVCSNLHLQYPSENYDVQSFQIAEKAKARTLLDIVYQGKIFQNLSEIPDSLRQSFIAYEHDIEKKYQTLSIELNISKESQNKLLISNLEEQLEELKRGKVKVVNELREKYPQYYTLTNPKIFGMQEVQQHLLNDKQMLLEYFVGQDEIFMWIISKTDRKFITLSLTKTELENRLAEISPIFNKQKEVIEIPVDYRWANVRLDLLYQLYKDLLEAPAADYLKNTQELIIIPDDILNYFPFEILVTDTTQQKITYLIQDYAISYAASASLLNPELIIKKRANNSLLAMGNPLFKTEKKEGFLEQLVKLVKYRTLFRGNEFQQLPNAEAEVKKIAENFENPTVYTGKQATERCFKQSAADYKNIHLATHFLVDDIQPMYSKIVLSQADNETEDGLLQTYEIYNMRLNADMVVLSGCNSGLGELKRGEGLMGISRAFLYAGIPSLVVTLWPVEDRSTAVLMDKFYKYIKKGYKKNKALQKAKIDLITSKDIMQDPFYWAPFILIGR